MRSKMRWLTVPITVVVLLLMGMPPSPADHGTRSEVKNLEAVADIENLGGAINSDMAFWGDLAFQGNFQGFQIHDISDPTNPSKLVDYEACAGGQGDVIIWEDLLVRTWDAPASDTATCGGELVGAGFEGLHFFDVSDPTDPVLIGDLPIVGGLVSVGGQEFFGAAAAFGEKVGFPGLTADIELVDDGEGPSDTDACEPLVGFTPGNIALVDRGNCDFTVKVKNAQDAGAVAVIVANHLVGGAGNMPGVDASITIPSLHVSLGTGNAIKASLPAEGTIAATESSGLSGCGAHTATGVPDPDNGRLLVYVGGSSQICPGMDLVEVPLNDVESATWYDRAEAGRACHDITVYMVNKQRAACSGSWPSNAIESGHGYTMFSMDDDLSNPVELYSKNLSRVSNQTAPFTLGHTSSFSWDGKILIFSTEPSGGTGAECLETDADENREMYFLFAESGNLVGTYRTPTQTADENCASVHIMQSIPTTNGRDVLSTGTYQAGTYVIDYTVPNVPKIIGYSDPPPNLAAGLLGGAWATYWYNGYLYESDIFSGLHIHRSTSPEAQTPVRLPFLNPQTMMPLPTPVVMCRGEEATLIGTAGADDIVGTAGRDVIAARGGNDSIQGRAGNDLICAGPGRDTVSGNNGRDRIFGQGGNDLLRGQKGNDFLHGGRGRDICNGGRGRDTGRSCEVSRNIP